MLGWGEVTEFAVEATMVEPFDVEQCFELEGFGGAPWSFPPNEVGLVKPDRGLGHSVVKLSPNVPLDGRAPISSRRSVYLILVYWVARFKGFTTIRPQNKITQSMSRSGCCLDNAAAESFFASPKTEIVYRIVLPTKASARREIVAWLNRYNRIRRHSHCALQAHMTYGN